MVGFIVKLMSLGAWEKIWTKVIDTVHFPFKYLSNQNSRASTVVVLV